MLIKRETLVPGFKMCLISLEPGNSIGYFEWPRPKTRSLSSIWSKHSGWAIDEVGLIASIPSKSVSNSIVQLKLE